jgi:predicted Holliday junction resolvase-like endonuclease
MWEIISFLILLLVISRLWYLLRRSEKARLFSEKNYKDLLSQKKSSEIITGQIAEKLAPFLKVFDYDPQNLQFLGSPVDYIAFNDDDGEVVFIEIKSGNSRLTAKQRKIKKIIKAGAVRWEEIRIK